MRIHLSETKWINLMIDILILYQMDNKCGGYTEYTVCIY